VRLTTSPLSCAECHEIWEPKTPGTLWATPRLLRESFTFTFYIFICILTLIYLKLAVQVYPQLGPTGCGDGHFSTSVITHKFMSVLNIEMPQIGPPLCEALKFYLNCAERDTVCTTHH